MVQVGVVLADRMSFRPAAVFGLSSSPSGTVFMSDRTGTIRVYFRPAPFAPSSQEVDLGPWSAPPDAPAVIVAEQVAIPRGGPHVGGVGTVDFWRSVPPNPSGTVTLAATETYVTNNGDGVIVYDTNGSRALRVRQFGGTAVIAIGTLPDDPPPNALSAEAIHNPRGAVLSALGDVFLLRFPNPTNPTPVPDAGGAAHRAISEDFVASATLGGTGTVIRRFLRSNPATPTETFSISDSVQALAVSDTGTAWTVQQADGSQQLFTRQVGATADVAFTRLLEWFEVCRFEDSDDFLVYDRGAAAPGFYRVSPGSTAGTLVGTVGPAQAFTWTLRVSHDRVLFGDDSTATMPLFLRSTTTLPTLGPELAVVTATTTPAPPTSRAFDTLPPVDLAGPFLAFTRPTAADPTRTELVYGRPGDPLNTVLLTATEVPFRIEVSGHRALLDRGATGVLVDLLTGTRTAVPPDCHRRLWGDYLVSLDIATAELRRTDLVTGDVAVVLPANPAGGPDDELVLATWGPQVVYAFRDGAGTLVSGVWTATSPTAGTITAFPRAADTQTAALSDRLLVTHEFSDDTVAHDLQSGTSALVDDRTLIIGPVADGFRLGWVRGDSRGVVDDVRNHLPGYQLGSPLLVGSRVPAAFQTGSTPWQPRFYVSRPVTWTLRISGPAGAVLAASGTSAFGEITLPLGWDGTDVAGSPVPAGTYTWTLTGTAAGTPLASLRGSSALSGHIIVS
jgi:hypothetical protein